MQPRQPQEPEYCAAEGEPGAACVSNGGADRPLGSTDVDDVTPVAPYVVEPTSVPFGIAGAPRLTSFMDTNLSPSTADVEGLKTRMLRFPSASRATPIPRRPA